MSEPHEPQSFDVAAGAIGVLQELQVILDPETYITDGRVLDAALVWYDDVSAAGDALRFSPPPAQPTWQSYERSLDIDPSPPAGEPVEIKEVMVGGEAQRRLARSERLLRLATPTGLDRIVRLKAEYHFRLADEWTIDVMTERQAES